MKKFIKIKSKKGFTLLETLLATAILVIIGSMLMEGFITAMGYSYNSSVYSRSASYNSALCIQQLSQWTMLAENKKSIKADGTYDTEEAGYKDVGQFAYDQTSSYSQPKTIQFGGGAVGASLGRIRVAIYEQKNINDDYNKKPAMGAGATNNLNSFKGEAIKDNTEAYADNRTILFYYPTVNGVPSNKYFGNTHLYMQSGKKVWGYDDAAGNGVYIADYVKQ